MLEREREVRAVVGLLKRHRVVGLVGARQVGKTTLARMVAKRVESPVTYLDLEDPESLARLQDPMLALKGLKGLVLIDEVQRLPDLFPVLRVLVDRPRNPVRFLVLGSASPELLRQGSETLAGRIVYRELGGFCLDEVGPKRHDRLWLRGGMPRSYLARSLKESHEWRRSFVRTFLERDVPQLGINVNATTLRRFWTMLAHYHGQIWNASEFARSFGVADTTVRAYFDRLAATLVVRQLQPWHENLSKRQVRAPKVYVADSGLLHVLLGIRSRPDLEAHPKVGASWEGFVIEQIRSRLGADLDECFFWATHSGAELDLLVVRGRTRLGFEVKRTTAPKVTPSMRHALTDLKLKRLDVVHAGETSFPLTEQIRAVSFSRLLTGLKPLA
jgi:predicted AAA+ superfamily ATPase